MHEQKSRKPVVRRAISHAHPIRHAAHTKRSVVVGSKASTKHHKTSISLEDVFWEDFRAMAAEMGRTLGQMLEQFEQERFEKGGDVYHHNLSSVVRIRTHQYWRRPNNPGIDTAAQAAAASEAVA